MIPDHGPRLNPDLVQKSFHSQLLFADKSQRREELQKNAVVVRVNGRDWKAIKNDLIQTEVSGMQGNHPLSDNALFELILNRGAINLVLRTASEGKVIGYCSAIRPDDPCAEGSELIDYQDGTRYISSITLHSDYQGYGLVAKLMQALEVEVLREGSHTITGKFADYNGFAAKIRRSYQGRITKEVPMESTWGPQIYMKIELRKHGE